MVTQPNATLPTHPHAPQEVEIDLGELVAQGGFHSNFQLLGVRSRDTNQWLLNQAEASISSQLAPPPPLTTKLLRRGSSNTSPGATAGSGLGLCYRRKGRRKSISGLDQMPPIPKSVKITMFAPFENHDNEMSRKGRRRGRRLTKSKSSWDINKTFEEDSGRQRQQEYVLKCLSYKTLQCPELKEQGLKDMQAEISMLRRFSHPGFHGAGTMTLEGFEDGVEYPIILLDRLKTTLDEKIEEWKAAQKKVTFAGRLPGNLNNRQRESCGHLYFERLGLVVNIAKALDYLHYQKSKLLVGVLCNPMQMLGFLPLVLHSTAILSSCYLPSHLSSPESGKYWF